MSYIIYQKNHKSMFNHNTVWKSDVDSEFEQKQIVSYRSRIKIRPWIKNDPLRDKIQQKSRSKSRRKHGNYYFYCTNNWYVRVDVVENISSYYDALQGDFVYNINTSISNKLGMGRIYFFLPEARFFSNEITEAGYHALVGFSAKNALQEQISFHKAWKR